LLAGERAIMQLYLLKAFGLRSFLFASFRVSRIAQQESLVAAT